jgi:hypothetical protein
MHQNIPISDAKDAQQWEDAAHTCTWCGIDTRADPDCRRGGRRTCTDCHRYFLERGVLPQIMKDAFRMRQA